MANVSIGLPNNRKKNNNKGTMYTEKYHRIYAISGRGPFLMPDATRTIQCVYFVWQSFSFWNASPIYPNNGTKKNCQHTCIYVQQSRHFIQHRVYWDAHCSVRPWFSASQTICTQIKLSFAINGLLIRFRKEICFYQIMTKLVAQPCTFRIRLTNPISVKNNNYFCKKMNAYNWMSFGCLFIRLMVWQLQWHGHGKWVASDATFWKGSRLKSIEH